MAARRTCTSRGGAPRSRSRPNTKFRVPAIDAPNVNGAHDLGLAVASKGDGDADLSALRTAIDQDRVAVLYVVDPGSRGSMGDVSWLVEARKSGRAADR